MTRQESVAREIHLAFDLLRHLCANPEQLEKIPDGAYVEIVTSERPTLPRDPVTSTRRAEDMFTVPR